MAASDTELALAFRGQLRRETARFRAWAEAWRRRGGGGCGWSGPTNGFVSVAPGDLLARARAALEERRAWAASPVGRLAERLARAEAAAQSMIRVLAEARALLDRAGPDLRGPVEREGGQSSFTPESRAAAASAAQPPARLRQEG